MLPHHEEAIQRATAHFRSDPEAQALILGGSVAHGFATPTSDVDVMIIIADRDYDERLRDGRLQFFDPELCTYDGGYVDGKYLGRSLLDKIAQRGSEPARFAFQDAQLLFSRLDGIEDVVRAIAQYPVADKGQRIERFYAQFEAWNWYAYEALKLDNRYLLSVAISKLVLFGGRLVLAHNELLYPYHKWFLEVLERALEKPPELLSRISALYDDPCAEHILSFYEAITQFRHWECHRIWSAQFMLDSELNWLEGASPVDDL
jgi:nucleotidyltransferase-like protein